MVAATLAAALVAACEDLPLGTQTLPLSSLLVLPLKSTAPPPAEVSFYVSNARPIVRRLIHVDGFNTLYVEVSFPSGSIASVGGTAVGSTDSVRVTLTPRSGQYGVTLSPASLVFASGRAPEATFSYAVYGEPSVADGSTTYATRLAYLDALRLWKDFSLSQWQRVAGSGPAGTDGVRGVLDEPGSYIVAAPR